MGANLSLEDCLRCERSYDSRLLLFLHYLYPVWSKYWSEASISSIENLIVLITVPVPHRRPG
jgi:hypothetical protein